MVKNDKNRWWGGVQKLFYFSLPPSPFSSSFKKEDDDE